MTGKRSVLSTVLMLAFGAAAVVPAAAQPYPTRPIKLIVPFSPGGPVDVTARIVTAHLPRILGQAVIIENRAGAAGALGAKAVASADPDGYTLLCGNISTLTVLPAVTNNRDYDPSKAFAPVAKLSQNHEVLVVHPAFSAKSVAQLIAHAKANPGKLNYGSAGTGTLPHLAGELFKSVAGIDLVHVPYRGGALSIADVIAGNVQLTFEASSPLLGHIRDGRLRALAVLSKARLPDLPDVPSSAESGYPSVSATTWTGLFAPAGMDAAIVAKLNAALNEGLKSAELKAALAKVGNVPLGGAPDALTRMLLAENARWAPIVKALNLKAD